MDPRSAPADRLASSVARLFFDRQLTKVEIAQRLGISRFRVARLLERAREDGLVRIEFHDPPDVDTVLGRDIEDRYGLDLCLVARSPSDNALDATASVAASLLAEWLGPDAVVGIAWGSTLAAVVERVAPHPAGSIEIVQLAGSSRHLERGHDPADVSRRLADRLGAQHRALFAPAFVDRPSLRTSLVAQPELADSFAAFDRLSLAVVGIGAIGGALGETRSSLLESGALGAGTVAQLRDRGAIGDLVVHPFDADGAFVAPDLASRAVAISVDRLRQVPRVLAVAVGAGKAAAIRGALRTGVVGSLVTDEAAARALVALDSAGAPAAGPAAARAAGRPRTVARIGRSGRVRR